MRRIVILVLAFFASVSVHAQTNYDLWRDGGFLWDLTHILSVLAVVFIIATSILSLIKLFFDYRIRNKIIEKGVGETVASQILQPDKKDPGNIAIKWFIIFAGIGMGLTLINFFQPFGIHSLAIMSFSIAAGFLGYYFFIKRSTKNNRLQ